jgi:hypothetical protein
MVIAMVGGMLAENQRPDKWAICLRKLRQGYVDLLNTDLHDRTVYGAVALSYDALDPEMKQMYRALVVFMRDALFSSEALCSVWASTPVHDDQPSSGRGSYRIIEPSDTDTPANILVKKSLLSSSFEECGYQYSLHGIMRDYLRQITTNEEIIVSMPIFHSPIINIRICNSAFCQNIQLTCNAHANL